MALDHATIYNMHHTNQLGRSQMMMLLWQCITGYLYMRLLTDSWLFGIHCCCWENSLMQYLNHKAYSKKCSVLMF